MARTDYGAEVRSAQTQETDKVVSGRKAGTTKTAGKQFPSRSNGPSGSDANPEDNRVTHAAGIAHAILGGRKMM